jgi:hypothetical protein
MGKKGGNDKHAADWAKAKKACRLNAETIRMAKELGISPKSLMKNKPSPSQRWKAPVHEWLRALYEKRFGRQGKSTTPPRVPGVDGCQVFMNNDVNESIPDDLQEDLYGMEGDFF